MSPAVGRRRRSNGRGEECGRLMPEHFEAGMVGTVAVVSAAQSGNAADGEVRKADKHAKKITIKHGPIPSLINMPQAMTMV